MPGHCKHSNEPVLTEIGLEFLYELLVSQGGIFIMKLLSYKDHYVMLMLDGDNVTQRIKFFLMSPVMTFQISLLLVIGQRQRNALLI